MFLRDKEGILVSSGKAGITTLFVLKMAKLQFQIGASEHVRIVLPSRQHGNSDLFIGKAMVRVEGLNCTLEVMITRSCLSHFFDQLDEACKTLKGTFQLESTNSRFKLKGSVNSKGAFQFEVVCTGLNFTQSENTEWSASVFFACGSLDYREAVSILQMEGDEQATAPISENPARGFGESK